MVYHFHIGKQAITKRKKKRAEQWIYLSLRDYFPRRIRATPFTIEGGVVTASKFVSSFRI